MTDPMPRLTFVDRSLAMLLEGYDFIGTRCRRYGSDVFESRLLMQRTVCMQGAEAARLFYDPERFRRAGSPPRRMRKTLLGEGSVLELDGEMHRARKQMFLSMMAPESVQRLARLARREWRRRLPRWESAGRVVLHREVREIHCRAVCTWAGVPLPDREVPRTAALLGALVDSPATVGPQYLRGRIARLRLEGWTGDVVDRVRRGALAVPPDTPVRIIATHRDANGRLLDRRTAAVELLNVLRPTVAVARFVVFAALALHHHPEWRARVRAGDDRDLELFVHEVRRFYPFFPMVVARVRSAFEWRRLRFRTGQRVLLDIYGTNRDPRRWRQPDVFDPERFRDRAEDAFDFIPQGGADHDGNHRCAGEWVTIELMKTAVRVLTQEMKYDVPPQDLTVPLSRIPALPNSGFVISPSASAR